MTDQREEMVSALRDEVLSEMAETFFAARKSVDEEVELFRSREEELRRAGQRALCLAELLSDLLAGKDTAARLWRELGVPEKAMTPAENVDFCPYRDMPFAWTRRGRYEKLLLDVYGDAWRAFDVYNNGEVMPVPGRAGRVRRLGYRRYRRWAAEINQQVERVNSAHAPSCVLAMARSFDVEGQEKLRVAGAGMNGYACSLDASLALELLDETVPSLPELPELPPPSEAAPVLRALAREVWRERAPQVEAVMARVDRARH